MATERTFSIIKPDATRRNLTGAINAMLESASLRIVAQKRIHMTKEQAEGFYAVHKERPFFGSLIEFITSSPVVAMVWQGKGAIASSRQIIGATNPLSAAPGTIRGDYGVDVGRNLIHGSDAPETAQSEIALWFGEDLVEWKPAATPWIYE